MYQPGEHAKYYSNRGWVLHNEGTWLQKVQTRRKNTKC